MIRTIPRVLVLFAALAATGGDVAAQSAADSVRSVDSAWARAYQMHDTALAQALFARDLAVTSGSGARKTRDGELADIRPTAGLRMHYFRTREVDVRVHGATAVVLGLAEWEFTYNGRVNQARRRYTAVYVRGGGGPLGWQMVALHLGPAPPP